MEMGGPRQSTASGHDVEEVEDVVDIEQWCGRRGGDSLEILEPLLDDGEQLLQQFARRASQVGSEEIPRKSRKR